MHNIIRAVERLCLLLVAVLGSTCALALDLQSGARFGFEASVEGERFTARFDGFAVQPLLDAQRRPRGFRVEIDMALIDSGNAERDAEMRGADWFDVARYPSARFVSDRVVQTATGWTSAGVLEIRGIAREIDVPFTWQLDEDGVRMRGHVRLDRRWFGVGPDDQSSVDAGVDVFFAFDWR